MNIQNWSNDLSFSIHVSLCLSQKYIRNIQAKCIFTSIRPLMHDGCISQILWNIHTSLCKCFLGIVHKLCMRRQCTCDSTRLRIDSNVFLHRLFIQSCNRYSTDTEIQKEMSEVGQSTSRLPQCRYKKGLLDDKMLALFLILFMSCLPVDHLERLAQIPPLLDNESLIHFQ